MTGRLVVIETHNVMITHQFSIAQCRSISKTVPVFRFNIAERIVDEPLDSTQQSIQIGLRAEYVSRNFMVSWPSAMRDVVAQAFKVLNGALGFVYEATIISQGRVHRLSVRPRYVGRSEERRVGKECRSRWSP